MIDGKGRIYITGRDLGIDLSPDWISVNWMVESRERYCLPGDGSIWNDFALDRHFELNVKFSMPSLNRFYPGNWKLQGPSPLFLLDKEVPALPERPIWLPKGPWECAYCNRCQEAYLLQCRGCGAPRIGETKENCWGFGR